MVDQPRDENPWDGAPRDPDHTQGLDPTEVEGQPPSGAGHDPWASGADTTILPPTSGTGEPPETDRWTARAGVPPAEQAVPQQWQEPEAEPGADRRWWAPALIGLLALLLLAMLGLGVWLIARSRDTPGPGPSASATPSTGAPSSAPPTSAPPSASPSVVAVAVPPLVGLKLADAQLLLSDRNLKSTVEERVDAGATPGTVLEASPAPGTMVAPGTTVKLIVAKAPPAPTTPAPTTPGG